MGKTFAAIHQFEQHHLDELGVAGFSDELIQDTINKYAETCRQLGCRAIRVISDYQGLRNICLTEAESAEQVVEAHEEGIPRDTITEVFEAHVFEPQAAE